MSLCLVVEGPTDEPVARALAADAGLRVALARVAQGKANIDRLLPNYRAAARHQPWFVLRDLDQDAPCAPEWLGDDARPTWLCLRLAVRATESWLLADPEQFAAYFRVSVNRVPKDPDSLVDPKRSLVDLVRHSTSPTIRGDVVPREGAHTQVGPGYVASIVGFTSESWRLHVAARRSDSLFRARRALRTIGERWRAFSGER
jgi:hypothetical protein